jgi:hypothetical protein
MAEVYEANDGMLGSDRWKRHEQERASTHRYPGAT